MNDQLKELVDRFAIQELTARYNRAIDDLDATSVAAIFTEDGLFDFGDGRPWRGRENIKKFVEHVKYGTVHITTDAVIEIDGDHATQVSTMLLCKRQKDRAETSYWLSGRYHDILRRTDDGWLFASRRAALDLAL